MPAVTVPQAFDLALQHHQAGRLAEAEALYRQILAVQPNHAETLHHLGVLAHQVGRHDLAVEWIRQALTLNPGNPAAHGNLGEALRGLERFDEAIAAYRHALAMQPNIPEVCNNLGNALKQQGRFAEATVAYRQAIALRPHYAIAHSNLGSVLTDQGRPEEAITACGRALALQPRSTEAHNNLGNALLALGRWDEATAAYREALEIDPGCTEARYNLGNALKDRGHLDEAAEAYRTILSTKSHSPEVWNNLGTILQQQGRFEEARESYRRALEIKPAYAEVHNNLGNLFKDEGRLDEAVAAYHQALHFHPHHPGVENNLGTVFKDQGRFDEAVAAYRRSLATDPAQLWVHSGLIFTLHLHPGEDGSSLTTEHQRWNQQFGHSPIPPTASAHPHRNPEARLRIGYVSPDLRDHVVGRNLLPLFRRHDHRQFEIHCYSGVLQPDPLTAEFRRHADHWRSTAGVADRALAEIIQQDEIDILVDLSQHTAGNRLPLFAHSPAPVQVSFAGYPDTTGLDAIPYRISDRYLEHDPSGITDRPAGQVLLIDTFWCYDPGEVEIEVNALPTQETGSVTFGSLNNFCKINEPVLQLWARVLTAIPHSRLILLSHAGSHRQRTVDFLAHAGIAAHRIEFVAPRPRRDYLALYHRIDIVLDTFPYNGHTTSLDALWMGVPVITLASRQSVSRAGLSQLTHLGLPDLVAHSGDDYVAIASRLARNLPRLTQLRAALRQRMETSVLMDAPRFAQQIEAAYRTMWHHWCAQQPA